MFVTIKNNRFCVLSLHFYRNGKLHCLTHSCSMNIQEDFEYWGFTDVLMDACCALKHYPELEISQNETKQDQKIRGVSYRGYMKKILEQA